jgi:hypothetical protein
MKYTQANRYQNIDGVGRNCDDRWDIIKKYVKRDETALSIDIGSAEGVFSKKLVDYSGGKVISVEGSDFVYNEQLKYCKEDINSGNIILHKKELNTNTISEFIQQKYNYTLLLSVLHWCDNPDLILSSLSDVSEYLFVELPDLSDTKSYGQEYLNRIRDEYDNIENYLQEISGKPIIGAYKVEGNNSQYRTIYILHKSEDVILVDVDKVYHLIHGNKNTIEGAYLSGDFEIVPLINSPVTSYLNGNINHYKSQPKLFYKREKNIEYLLNEYEIGERDWLLKAVFYKGKYILSDGMHRSSILHKKGYRKIYVKIVSWTTEKTATFERFIKDENIKEFPIVDERISKRINTVIELIDDILFREDDINSNQLLKDKIEQSLLFLKEAYIITLSP